MPISNFWLNQSVNAVLSGIQDIEFNASTTATAVGYRYVKSTVEKIPRGKQQIIIPGTPELVNREISVNLISGSRVFLVWDGMEKEQINFLTLNPGQATYKDTTDGGIRLDAIAVDDDVELVIVVRQQEPITYKLGGEDVTDVSVSLWVQTDISYSHHISDNDIATKINNLTESDDDIVGYKIFVINGFTPGEAITFNINAADAAYGGNKIQMQLIKPFEFMLFLFKTGINNLLSAKLSDFISSPEGLNNIFTYGGKTASATGGELIITPKLDFFVGRFVAVNNFLGSGDTCIMTEAINPTHRILNKVEHLHLKVFNC